jgi:hypothetical protein
MASTIDLSGLEHYIKVLQRYSELLNSFHSAMEELCAKATKFAKKQYSNEQHFEITVDYKNYGRMATIYANGEQVAFYEFGTGKVGSGTYWGNLPTSDVPITVSWEYYYPSKAKRKSSYTGEEGWFFENKFQKGIVAEAEMWKTAEYIRQQAPIIIKNHLNIMAKQSGG